MRTGLMVLAFAIGAVTAAPPTAAQVFYGGYDTGPDYGAMLEDALRAQDAAVRELEAAAAALVQQAMETPECKAMFVAYQRSGGPLGYADFAFLYVATARFTPDGIARFQQTEADNRKQEALRLIDLRQMEVVRLQAQLDWANGYANAEQRAGTVLGPAGTVPLVFDSQKVERPQFFFGRIEAR